MFCFKFHNLSFKMVDHIKKLNYQTVFLIDEELRNSHISGSEKVEDTVNLIRCSLLRILTYFGNASCDYEESERLSTIASNYVVNLEWGVKFFSSSSRDEKHLERVQFMEYNLKQFEDFETELEARLNRPFAGLGKSVISDEKKSNMFGNLQSALERLMYDFPWDRPDITSPVKLRRTSHRQPNKRGRFDDDDTDSRRNFVFIVAKCPHTAQDLQTEAHCETNASSVLKAILLHRVCREFSEVRRLRLFWLDVNTKVSGEMSGLKLVSDALELVHGGVVSVGSILSLGTLDTMHIHSLLKCSGEVPNTSSRNGQSEDSEKNTLPKDSRQVTATGIPLPFMSSLSHSVKSLKSITCFEKELDGVLVLDNGGVSICNVIVQKLVAHSAAKSVSEKEHANIAIYSENSHALQSHFTVSFQSGNAQKAMKIPSGSVDTASPQVFSTVATLSGEVLSMLALQAEDVYMVMGSKKRADSNNESQFEDLLMHLAMSGKILVVCSQGSSGALPSSFGFLRPLTSVSATLMFFRSAVSLTLDQLLRSKWNEMHQENDKVSSQGFSSQTIREIFQHLPCVDMLDLSPAEDLQTSCKRMSTASFHPLLLERWFAPECIAESNDFLLSVICRDNTGQGGTDAERNLLRQLQEHHNGQNVRNNRSNSVLTSPESSFVGLKKFSSGKDLKMEHRKAGTIEDQDSRKAADDFNYSQKTRSSLRGTPRKSLGRTPEKASRRSPGKARRNTPRKTPKKTPRKSPKKLADVAAFKAVGRSSPTRQTERSIKASSSRMTLSGLKRHLSLRSGDIDRRLSLGVAIPTSRTELIIQKSKEALARKNQLEKEQESRNTARADQKGSTQNQKNGQVTTTGWQELHSVEELLSHLQTMYTKVVEGEGSPMIGAKSIFSCALQFFQNQCDDTAQTSASSLLREHLCLSSFKVKEKYKGKSDASALECKFREFLLQVCLQFEMNSEAEADENSEDVASELASMLSSVAIVKGANFLSTYLNDLLESYLDSSSKLLFRIHENLGRSAPPQLQHLLSPEQQDEDHSSLPPPSTQRMPSVSSAASNNSNSNENVQQKKRSFYRYPTFNPIPMKQILLEPKNLKNITRRSARIASSSKLNATQVADHVETKRVKRTLFGSSEQTDNVGRRLSLPSNSLSSLASGISCPVEKPRLRSTDGSFTPAVKAHHVLKTRKVSETPVHKQGRNSVLHKMERLRRYSNIQSEGVEVVEESPMKPFPDRNMDTLMTGSMKSDGQERMKRRTSFYSTTAAAESRNVNRYKRLEERMTQQVTSPTSPEKPPVPTSSKVLMTSPRRITARVLFGLSPSPCKRIIGPRCSKDANVTPKFASPSNRSIPTSTITTNSVIDLTSPNMLESFGVTFLESPAKLSAANPGVTCFTSPAKNTRLQARLESRLPSSGQTSLPETLKSSFMSPAKGASQEVDNDSLLFPTKSTRLPAQLDRDQLVSSSQSRVDFSNLISPTKGRVVCALLDFSSPAKNTRFQARQESSHKSKGRSTLHLMDELVACSSPPRTKSSFLTTTPTSKVQSCAATDSPILVKSSPTFGPCRQRTTVDSSPVFSSGKGCGSNIAEINFASKRSSPEISGSRSKCGLKQSESRSNVESPVHNKAKKRLLWSPDSGRARKKFC